MSDLIVVSFKSEDTADQALNRLQALQREYVVERLFILARRMNFDKVLPELKTFGGKVLKTSLSNKEEEHLRHALEGLGTVPA